MKINVVGLGYIGLPTSLMFAVNNFDVVGTDINNDLLSKLNRGEITFEEKGLDELLNSAKRKGIKFSNHPVAADMYIVAVPTPYDKITKKVDSVYVKKAVQDIIAICNPGSAIVIESTISPGTINKEIVPIIEASQFTLDKDIFIAHAPERIIPGNMIYELMHNSRTIGCNDKEMANIIANAYRKITTGDVVTTDVKSAEMTKVVENTYRAINIAFANELAKICEIAGMDVYEIIKICNMHPRVNILNPGPGVGGHCISVDPWFLVGDFPRTTKLINQAMDINQNMPNFVLEKIHQIMNENNITDYNKVGLYGLTYKENVDDFRESPTLQLIESQKEHCGTPLKSFDPFIKKQIVENQCFNFDEFLEGIEIIVIMVKHSHIIQNLSKIENKIIFDTQNIIKKGKIYKL